MCIKSISIAYITFITALIIDIIIILLYQLCINNKLQCNIYSSPNSNRIQNVFYWINICLTFISGSFLTRVIQLTKDRNNKKMSYIMIT
jgi:hypothetical protein